MGSFVLADTGFITSFHNQAAEKSGHIANFLDGQRWIQITHPTPGWVSSGALAALAAETSPMISTLLEQQQDGTKKPLSAGRYVLGTVFDGVGWVDQWPVGSGGIGATVGGTIREMVVPVSIADLLVTSKKAYLSYH
jgi:hypothetical protein